MKKIKMLRGVTLTFEEGRNKYLENCRHRNLREGTTLILLSKMSLLTTMIFRSAISTLQV